MNKNLNSNQHALGLHQIRNSLIVTSIVIFLGLIMGYILTVGVSITDKSKSVNAAHDSGKLRSAESGESEVLKSVH